MWLLSFPQHRMFKSHPTLIPHSGEGWGVPVTHRILWGRRDPGGAGHEVLQVQVLAEVHLAGQHLEDGARASIDRPPPVQGMAMVRKRGVGTTGPCQRHILPTAPYFNAIDTRSPAKVPSKQGVCQRHGGSWTGEGNDPGGGSAQQLEKSLPRADCPPPDDKI